MITGVTYFNVSCNTIVERMIAFFTVMLGIIFNAYLTSNLTNIIMAKVQSKDKL